MTRRVRQTIAVARKDLRSELRTRYALNASGMFVAVVVFVVTYSIGSEPITAPVTAALLWICLFFTAVTSLSRSFVAESERNTLLLLRLSIPSTPVYFGKLLFNLAVGLISNGAIIALFLLFQPKSYQGSVLVLFLVTFVLSLGLAAAMTIVSAILTRTSARGALSAVLSFPILLPLVFLGVEALKRGASGRGIEVMSGQLVLSGAYDVIVVSVSYILFDILWKE